MTLQQLKYAITVADKSSMSEAAKSLFISQPSLSNAIKELEKQIGITIFIRTSRGITVSSEGLEFLGYARQVVEQAELLEEKYLGGEPARARFSVSTQHYSFAVDAFVELIKENNAEEYDFTLRETRTYEIIDDVKNLNSEIGIIYLSSFNEKVIGKLISESSLCFHQLFTASPHIFISSSHPLAAQKSVTLDELVDFPYLSFEQGEYNSFYFSEEILSTQFHKKAIRVSDRATLFNLAIGLNGFTFSTGIISKALNGNGIIAVPLNIDEKIRIGYLTHKNAAISRLGSIYIDKIKKTSKNILLT